MAKGEAAALLCCFTLSKHLACSFNNTDAYSQPVKWKTTEKWKTNRSSILQRVDIYLAENEDELRNMEVLTGLPIWHPISKHRKWKVH